LKIEGDKSFTPQRKTRSRSRSPWKSFQPRTGVFVGPKRIMTDDADSSVYDRLYSKPKKKPSRPQVKAKAKAMKRPSSMSYPPRGKQLRLDHYIK
jgi:hypothetical protein